jgi:hypothetical protein
MIWSANYLDRYRCKAIHAEGSCPTGGKINNTSFDEWPSIIDAASGAASVVFVCYTDMRAKG